MSAAKWEQQSWDAGESGGVGDERHKDWVVAKYAECLGFCGNHTTIRIINYQFGNGDTDLEG